MFSLQERSWEWWFVKANEVVSTCGNSRPTVDILSYAEDGISSIQHISLEKLFIFSGIFSLSVKNLVVIVNSDRALDISFNIQVITVPRKLAKQGSRFLDVRSIPF